MILYCKGIEEDANYNVLLLSKMKCSYGSLYKACRLLQEHKGLVSKDSLSEHSAKSVYLLTFDLRILDPIGEVCRYIFNGACENRGLEAQTFEMVNDEYAL